MEGSASPWLKVYRSVDNPSSGARWEFVSRAAAPVITDSSQLHEGIIETWMVLEDEEIYTGDEDNRVHIQLWPYVFEKQQKKFHCSSVDNHNNLNVFWN